MYVEKGQEYSPIIQIFVKGDLWLKQLCGAHSVTYRMTCHVCDRRSLYS